MKKILLLGATGSIGQSTFELVRKNSDKFKIVGASAHARFSDLEVLAAEFEIAHLLNTSEPFDFSEFLKRCEPDIVLNAVVGFAGLKFTMETLRQKIPLALANKESLVAGGGLVMALSRESKVPIIPVDSEHSALFQCLEGRRSDFKKMYLTCSGGPFLGWKDLSQVTRKQALKHPNWHMGAKITIDSATLANKCLEVFEAMHLFGVSREQIEIVIHRESVVHSMVEFADTSILAQLSLPSMILPIAYALHYPERVDFGFSSQSFKNLNLSFAEPDQQTFSILQVLDHCADQMENFPIVFNASNEVLVDLFLDGKIAFMDIFKGVEKVIQATSLEVVDSFEKIVEIDRRARELVVEMIVSSE